MRQMKCAPLLIARGVAREEVVVADKGLVHKQGLALRVLSMLIMFGVGLMFGVLLDMHMPQFNPHTKHLLCNGYFTPNLHALHSLKAIPNKSIPSSPNLSIPSSPEVDHSTPKIDEMIHLHHWLDALATLTHHNMSDSQLFWLSSMMPMRQGMPLPRIPKVAFMFLSKGTLPLAPLWERFFQGNEGLYSIYVHTDPKFTLDVPSSSVFYRRQVPSKDVKWGDVTMLDGERRLIANALLDFTNERFVLLSESCIPLYNFSIIYSYIISSNSSFVHSMDELGQCGRGRYNGYMAPLITLNNWRKGSQWFEVNRKLAIYIVSDTLYYPIFRAHCKGACYADEHYLPTMLSMELGSQIENRTLTWVDWSKQGPHPSTFQEKDITEEFIIRIQKIHDCSHNKIDGSMCFLFARKFSLSTLNPLLQMASSVMGIKEET